MASFTNNQATYAMLRHVGEALADTLRLVTSYSFIASTIFASTIAYVIYQLYFHPLAKVPGPRPAALTRLWWFAHIAFDEATYLTVELHKKYGHAVRIAPNEVVFDTVEATKEIYKAGSGFTKAPWYDTARDDKTYLFMPDDRWDLFPETDMAMHRVQRRLAGPPYTINAMKRHEKHLDIVLKAFMDKVMSKFAGKVMELDHWIHLYVLDSVAQMTMSTRPDYISHEADGGILARADTMWYMFSVCGQWKLTTYLFHLHGYIKNRYFGSGKRREAHAKIPSLFAFSLSHLEKRMSQAIGTSVDISKLSRDFYEVNDSKPAAEVTQAEVGLADDTSGPTDILADLLQIQLKRSDQWTKQWTIGMSMTNFGAGHDTITSTLVSILVLISSNPAVLKRVRSEIAAAIAAGSMPDPAATEDSNETSYPSYDQAFDALPYLGACIKEAMRLRPVIGMSMVRYVPMTGAVIENHAIPAGTIVGVTPFALNRNQSIFGADVNDFKPERWISIPDSKDKDNDDEHSDGATHGHANANSGSGSGSADDAALAWSRNNLNWGGPSRTCPGQHLAKIIMLKLLVVLLRSVRLEVVEGGKESKSFLMRLCEVEVKVVVDPVEVEGKAT